MDSKTRSFVRRARVSAHAGPYLLAAGCIFAGMGIFFYPGVQIAPMLVMAVLAIALQFPRQYGWRKKSDLIELASLLTMPVIIAIIAYFWLRPNGALSIWTVLQVLGAFFIAIGVFHILTKSHTLRLADEIESMK